MTMRAFASIAKTTTPLKPLCVMASLNSSMNLLGTRRGYHYEKGTAKDMMQKSCYQGVNFIIDQDATVMEAIKRMAGINLGCLAVSDDKNMFVGVVTERDYLKKVELQGLTAEETLVSSIMTKRSRLVVAKAHETPAQLMTKMLNSDVRHLPVVDNNNDIIGMLSIKDIVREVNREHEADLDTLTNFSLGKGGHFVLD
jgi:signal-transduction protein with cAMP-binding, CBS, and nucleotidyltransferase domain